MCLEAHARTGAKHLSAEDGVGNQHDVSGAQALQLGLDKRFVRLVLGWLLAGIQDGALSLPTFLQWWCTAR